MIERFSKLQSSVCQAALKIAARHAWDRITLEQIAKQSKLSLDKVRHRYSARDDILPDLVHMTDMQLATDFKSDTLTGTPRENLFEILMARFDALQEHRAAYLNIISAMRRNSCAAIKLTKALHNSMQKMLALSQLRTDAGSAAGLLILYTATSLSWERDTSPDLAKTMAALDRNLSRAERLMSFVRVQS